MKRLKLWAAFGFAFTVTPAFGTWTYEGQWGSTARATASSITRKGVAVPRAATSTSPIRDNSRIQYSPRAAPTSASGVLGRATASSTGRGASPSPLERQYLRRRYGNDRIQYFTATGSYLGQWGSIGSGNGQLIARRALPTPGGNVYVADTCNCRIEYFTASGSYLGQWGRVAPVTAISITRGASPSPPAVTSTSLIRITTASNTLPRAAPSLANGALTA